MNVLKEAKRPHWLLDAGDSEDSIGGRDTDIAQIGYSLRHRIKEAFPINKVPETVTTPLSDIVEALEVNERMIQTLIKIVTLEMIDD